MWGAISEVPCIVELVLFNKCTCKVRGAISEDSCIVELVLFIWRKPVGTAESLATHNAKPSINQLYAQVTIMRIFLRSILCTTPVALVTSDLSPGLRKWKTEVSHLTVRTVSFKIVCRFTVYNRLWLNNYFNGTLLVCWGLHRLAQLGKINLLFSLCLILWGTNVQLLFIVCGTLPNTTSGWYLCVSW